MNQLRIKNMVCDRCIATVEKIMGSLSENDFQVALGEVTYEGSLDLPALDQQLKENGFERIMAREDALVEEVKLFLQGIVKQTPIQLKDKLSILLAHAFHVNYPQLSKIFSQHEHITIERYYLLLKVEKAKELIQCTDMNFTEIANLLDYSHANHLSRQFKELVGMSLSEFKKQKTIPRKPIDKIV